MIRINIIAGGSHKVVKSRTFEDRELEEAKLWGRDEIASRKKGGLKGFATIYHFGGVDCPADALIKNSP